jgi:hypothetical protein
VETHKLGRSGIDIAPLLLGGNVFGWTIDEKASINVLNAFVDQGFGRWLKARPTPRGTVCAQRWPPSGSLDRLLYLDIRQPADPGRRAR